MDSSEHYNKRRDINFTEKLDKLADRFLSMSKEFTFCGNGSYYVFDTLKEKLVYKEDD
jgi:hypothetical protein